MVQSGSFFWLGLFLQIGPNFIKLFSKRYCQNNCLCSMGSNYQGTSLHQCSLYSIFAVISFLLSITCVGLAFFLPNNYSYDMGPRPVYYIVKPTNHIPVNVDLSINFVRIKQKHLFD